MGVGKMNAPERIWLQPYLGAFEAKQNEDGVEYVRAGRPMSTLGGLARQNEDGVEYVRADLYERLEGMLDDCECGMRPTRPAATVEEWNAAMARGGDQ
jgi:hypothetical protein